MLGDVEETIYMVDDEAENDEVKTLSKKSEMLFVRGRWATSRIMQLSRPDPILALGDSVVLISPYSQS